MCVFSCCCCRCRRFHCTSNLNVTVLNSSMEVCVVLARSTKITTFETQIKIVTILHVVASSEDTQQWSTPKPTAWRTTIRIRVTTTTTAKRKAPNNASVKSCRYLKTLSQHNSNAALLSIILLRLRPNKRESYVNICRRQWVPKVKTGKSVLKVR